MPAGRKAAPSSIESRLQYADDDNVRVPDEWIERGRRDPGWFIEEILGGHSWVAQTRIAEAVRDTHRTFVRSCNGAGKSWTAARIAIWYLYTRPESIVVTTAPTFRQVKRILWQEMRKAHSKARHAMGGQPDITQLDLKDGWYALGFSTTDPDAFQGLHAEHGDILVIFDEASGIEAPIWEGADAVLTTDNARFLAIGNPTDPTTMFAAGFKDPNAAKIRISAFDTPNFTHFGIDPGDIASGRWEGLVAGEDMPFPGLITPRVVAERRQRWGEGSPMYVSRVLGNFPDDAEDVLIPLSWIEDAMARTLEPVATDPIEIGVDVARGGSDETVIYLRHGPQARMLDARRSKVGQKIMTTQTVARVIRFIKNAADTLKKEVADVKVDDIGVGGGVTDGLEAEGVPTSGINVGTSARDKERYFNRKAELYWGLRQRFEDGDVDLGEDEETLAQLSNIKWFETPRGQIKIEPKEEMAKRGLPSPDRAEALMLCYSGGGPMVMNDETLRFADESRVLQELESMGESVMEQDTADELAAGDDEGLRWG